MSASQELNAIILGLIALTVVLTAGFVALQLLNSYREKKRLAEMVKSGRNLPASLYPVIDTDICIGSGACVAACPEQDVLGIVNGMGRLIHGAACIGHGRCAAECPVDAIRLVFGTEERGVDIPHITGTFETSRAGIYIAGELGGMGLIRNAIRQGIGAARNAMGSIQGGSSVPGHALLPVVGQDVAASPFDAVPSTMVGTVRPVAEGPDLGDLLASTRTPHGRPKSPEAIFQDVHGGPTDEHDFANARPQKTNSFPKPPLGTLTMLGGLHGGRAFPLVQRETRIGRAPDCVVRVDGDNVSRHHASIHMVATAYRLVDADSTNGTLVNGKRVTEIQLDDGDRVQVGPNLFRFSVRAASRTVMASANLKPLEFSPAGILSAPPSYPPPPEPPKPAAPVPTGITQTVDVLLVGAGPAGLAGALACKERGVSFALIEQNRLGGAAAAYPRHKVVMTEPIEVPLFGTIHKPEITKEELLELWNNIAQKTDLKVQTGVTFKGLDGNDGAFVAHTSAGDIACKKIILAIGRRGAPRKLGVPGEDGTHVTYELIDPEQYKKAKVVVIGGGDSALEAAWQLTEEAEATVNLVHRSEGFRGKAKNVEHVEALRKEARLGVFLNTKTLKILPGSVEVNTPAGPRSLPADYVIILIGGELPTALLESLNIRIDKWFGAAPQGAPKVDPVRAGKKEPWTDKYLAPLVLVAGFLGLAFLAWKGRAYYVLDHAARETNPDHGTLRSSGNWGHGVGVVATLVMFTNFFYAARKRWDFMKALGSMRAWLDVHAVVGLMAPAYIAFHAAFRSHNLVATVSYVAVGAVVVTGVLGRYVFTKMKTSADKKPSMLKRVLKQWRVFHVVLAIVMVVVITAHVVVSILFGYRWIFS